MAREYAIPSSSTILQDFGLAVTTPPTARNRRVVIIGTSEDGPLYEPVVVDLPTDAELVWGRQSRGDLVRGISECWNSQSNNQNVVGVRIGNAKKSILEIGEINSNDIDTEDSDTNINSLVLEGRFPGPVYDQVTIQYDTSRANAGDISVYNPKTGLYSYFTVDRKNPNNSSVQVHNVAELVAAINNDRNTSSVVTASFDDLTTDYELMVKSGDAGVNSTTTKVELTLPTILALSGVIADSNDAYIVTDPDLPYGEDVLDGNGVRKNVTVGNNIIALDSVQAVGISDWKLQTFTGTSTKLGLTPLDGKGTSRWNTIQALNDYDADYQYATDPSGNVTSEYMYDVNFALIDEIPTDEKGLDEENKFSFTIDKPFDDTENPYVTVESGVVYNYLLGNTDYVNYFDNNYFDATCKGVKVISAEPSGLRRPYGSVRVFASNNVDPNGNWTEIPYSPESGVYISEFVEATSTTDAEVIFSVGSGASGCYDDVNIANLTNITFDTGIPKVDPVKFTNMSALIDKDGNIKDNTYLRVTGTSVKGFMSELDTYSQLENVSAITPTNYFVRGDELLLNVAAPFPMIMNYGTKRTYEVGTNVILSDANKGVLTFTDTNNLPGPGGEQLDSTEASHIRLNYSYMPNFPDITSKAKALNGGTTGANLSVKEREDELKKAYEYLRNFEGDVWVPMGAYIDDIKQDYNENTGLLENQANSFAADIEDFLDEQSINLFQPHAVLGTTQIDGDTIGDRDEWVKNLTEVDFDDPTRGANTMSTIQNKFISVAAFEPVFLNTGRGTPYAANGQASYAGLLASVPYDVSPTNKSIPGIYATRFPFTIRQLEALNGNRYVAMKTSDTRPPVVVNDITAAPLGSDYINYSIFSITKEAADRIKRLADNYIGRPNSVEIKNALDQDISNILKNMSGIQAFNYSLSSTIEQQILGVVEIDLIIVPVFTMKKIRTTVKLRKNVALS